jgi:hypothetical protein
MMDEHGFIDLLVIGNAKGLQVQVPHGGTRARVALLYQLRSFLADRLRCLIASHLLCTVHVVNSVYLADLVTTRPSPPRSMLCGLWYLENFNEILVLHVEYMCSVSSSQLGSMVTTVTRQAISRSSHAFLSAVSPILGHTLTYGSGGRR